MNPIRIACAVAVAAAALAGCVGSNAPTTAIASHDGNATVDRRPTRAPVPSTQALPASPMQSPALSRELS
jgi:hypothetical protein